MKVLRFDNSLIVIMNDGKTLTSNSCDDELFEKVLWAQDNDDEDQIMQLMVPELFKKQAERETKIALLNSYEESEYLDVVGQSVYIRCISELTVPEDLAFAIYNAEMESDWEKIQSYLNFWTLASLNPDSRARTNLFWFLQRYGMKISSSGLFVAYRNVVLKEEGSEIGPELAKVISKNYAKVKFSHKKTPKNYQIVKSEDGYECVKYHPDNYYHGALFGNLEELYEKLGEDLSTNYTDDYTGTFDIRIGKPVSMPRENCDPVQENTCSSGLHVAGRDWLTQNYCGRIPLKVLVSPSDVVAVPKADNYGKMRVCAYYPVEVLEWGQDGNMIEHDIEDGFEDNFIDLLTYQGDVNNEDDGNYSIKIPEIPEIDGRIMETRLMEIRNFIKSKIIN